MTSDEEMYYDRRYSETVLPKEEQSGLPYKRELFCLLVILVMLFVLF